MIENTATSTEDFISETFWANQVSNQILTLLICISPPKKKIEERNPAEQTVVKAWKEITNNEIENLVKSIGHRVEAVIVRN